jgi:hypothetical protein
VCGGRKGPHVFFPAKKLRNAPWEVVPAPPTNQKNRVLCIRYDTVEEMKSYSVLLAFLGMVQDGTSACSVIAFRRLEPLSLFGNVLKVGFGYASYSIAVDYVMTRRFDAILNASQKPVLPISSRRYSDRDGASKATTIATKHTQKSQEGEEEQSAIPPVSDLRKTISRFSHIVEDPRDRQRWNSWALAMPAAPTNESSSSAVAVASAPAGKRYRFAYRSYVNAEEKNGMLTSRLTFHRFRRNNFSSRKVGIMTFKEQELVTLVDFFWMGLFRPVTITWYGRIVDVTTRGRRGEKRIIWTSTVMKWPGKTILDPPVSDRLRQTPWDIVKEDDGMLLLQRGDIGVLAYDRID